MLSFVEKYYQSMTDGSHIGKLETEMKQLATLNRKKSSPLLHTQEKSKE